jgi:hypothetical protein
MIRLLASIFCLIVLAPFLSGEEKIEEWSFSWKLYSTDDLRLTIELDDQGAAGYQIAGRMTGIRISSVDVEMIGTCLASLAPTLLDGSAKPSKTVCGKMMVEVSQNDDGSMSTRIAENRDLSMNMVFLKPKDVKLMAPLMQGAKERIAFARTQMAKALAPAKVP